MSKSNRSANLAYENIINDSYLFYVYSSNYLRMIQMVDLTREDDLSWHDFEAILKDKKVVEIGSAGGILKKLAPWVITTDVRSGPDIDLVMDGRSLGFNDQEIDFLLAKDTLHHIPDVYLHFEELMRCLASEGKAVYLEPNWNIWSKFIYKVFHPEDWNENVNMWNLKFENPMSSNQALAKLLFFTNLKEFEEKFPDLKVHVDPNPVNGLSYLLSGGVYKRNIIPSSWLLRLMKIERYSRTWMNFFGLNRIIVISKPKNPLD